MSEQDEKFSSLLVWLDMEMTGLDPEKNHVLEVATIITDGDLNVIEEGPHLVVHQPEEILNAMDEWCTQTHTDNGLIEKVRASTISVQQAEAETLIFIQKHCKAKEAPLCGNSIEQDRRFIVKFMPQLDAFLHYRHVNVSSVKEMVQRWYKDDSKRDFEKKQIHLALDDILESIAELKHYRDHFFV
jgi:oligoribonuclease